MKIGIFNNTPDRIVGCKKVMDNLVKGLKEIGQEYVENELGDVNGSIHGAVKEFQEKSLPPNTLIGPEIVVTPNETDAWTKYRNWVQPSKWVVDYMKTFKQCENTIFYPWSVGIDTDEFTPNPVKFEQSCFIYYKNVTKQTPPEKLKKLEGVLNKIGLSYKVITYGDYTEDELKHLCNTSNFCIMLAGTESQGIAYMEILSMGLPLYVIDETTFSYNGFTYEGASSAPYFDDICGIKHHNLNLLGEFMDNLSNYHPREYILTNHTCARSAEKYVEILRKCHECN